MNNYSEIYNELNNQTCVLCFLKKNGDVRLMLGTRNLTTTSLIYGWIPGELNKLENRCSIDNGNIAIIDLNLGEGRSFNIDRLIWHKSVGEIKTREELNIVMGEYIEFSKKYKEMNPEAVSLGIDSLDKKVVIPQVELTEFNKVSLDLNSSNSSNIQRHNLII